MHPILSREQMRELDRYAIESCKVPGLILMENAGRGAAEIIFGLVSTAFRETGFWDSNAWEKDSIPQIVIVCGMGNNGGDGFVIARHLLRNNFRVIVCLLGNPTDLKGDAKINHDAFVGLGGEVVEINPHADTKWHSKLNRILDEAKYIVDAVFGTGLDREVTDWRAQAIETINETNAVRISLDVPSGLDANTGRVLGAAVQADVTITFGGMKSGLLGSSRQSHVGPIHVAHIGVPISLVDHTGHDARLWSPPCLHIVLSPAHKVIESQNPRVGVISCDPKYTWALGLAARGAHNPVPSRVTAVVSNDINTEDAALPKDTVSFTLSQLSEKVISHTQKSFDLLVFPAATKADVPCILAARKHFDGVIVIGLAEVESEIAHALQCEGGRVVVVTNEQDLAELYARLDNDKKNKPVSRFGLMRESCAMLEATVVLLDNNPVCCTTKPVVPDSPYPSETPDIVNVPDAQAQNVDVWSVFSKDLETLPMRALFCGVVGRMCHWCNDSLAALSSLFFVGASMKQQPRERTLAVPLEHDEAYAVALKVAEDLSNALHNEIEDPTDWYSEGNLSIQYDSEAQEPGSTEKRILMNR